MGDYIKGLVTLIIGTLNPIVDRGWSAGDTAAVVHGADLGTVTILVIRTHKIAGHVLDDVITVITGVNRAINAIVGRRGGSILAPEDCVAGLGTIAPQFVVAKTVLGTMVNHHVIFIAIVGSAGITVFNGLRHGWNATEVAVANLDAIAPGTIIALNREVTANTVHAGIDGAGIAVIAIRM
jgi:hypothetical protein